ncbi:CatB-related O-acetyltransferase [Aliagarivorans marinus]|uniref:CatB-related O-acetyltransferase n=1 Tax=Aliagarivorans marinus TaxID=561965 RepID=UPI00047A92BA|nr:CatB-related O-acetyltransferase [Aliagarivorans marinus]
MEKHSTIKAKSVHETAVLEHPVHVTAGVVLGRAVSLGKYTYISEGTRVNSGTQIGRFCSIATDCELGAQDHPLDWLSTHPFQYSPNQFKSCQEYVGVKHIKWSAGPITIVGNDVWIGSKSIVCRGVKVGDGAVIGAGSFVNKDVPNYAVVAGTPARIIRYRFTPEIISELIDLKWWEKDISEIGNLNFSSIKDCIDKLKLTKEESK